MIDLDAHQGNGVARIFAGVASPLENRDRTVHIFDMYNRDIYSQDRQAIDRIDRNLPLASGTRSAEYLDKLQQYLPSFLNQIDSPSAEAEAPPTPTTENRLLQCWNGYL